MTTKTKPFSSAMVGAPALTGLVGGLLPILDACLVTGFGLQTATSLVVVGGVATATFATTHAAVKDTVVLITGATPSGLNGEHRVTVHAGNTVKFATTEADVTATGTITVKVAPLGWTNPFTGTNKSVYKMVDAQGTGFCLRVVDTGTTSARVIGYEAMTDVDTGFGPFPTTAQMSGGDWWSKSAGGNATVVSWRIVGDSRGFYFSVNNYGASSAYQTFYFGDIKSVKSNDPYACVLTGASSDVAGQQNTYGGQILYSYGIGYNYTGLWAARAANAIGGSTRMVNTLAMSMTSQAAFSMGAYGTPFPSPVDNGLIFSPIMVWNESGLRGYYPGLVSTPQTANAAFSTDDIVTGTGELAGKTFIVIKEGYHTANTNQAIGFIEHTGDWVR